MEVENKKKGEGKRKEEETQKEVAPTPAQAQEALSDQPSANLPCHGHVGLPGLSQDPAEGRQEEKVQKGRGHDADALRERKEKRRFQSLLFKQPQ